jgi:tetratricopeptide (TPR) repeat protein
MGDVTRRGFRLEFLPPVWALCLLLGLAGSGLAETVVHWEETPRELVKVMLEDGREVGRWVFPKREIAWRTTIGEDLETLLELAEEALARGKSKQSIKLFELALEKAQDAGEAEEGVVEILAGLAQAYAKEGNNVFAELFLKRVVSSRRRIYGLYAPVVAESLERLAKLYLDMGRLREARPALEEARRIRRAVPLTSRVEGSPSVSHRETASGERHPPLFVDAKVAPEFLPIGARSEEFQRTASGSQPGSHPSKGKRTTPDGKHLGKPRSFLDRFARVAQTPVDESFTLDPPVPPSRMAEAISDGSPTASRNASELSSPDLSSQTPVDESLPIDPENLSADLAPLAYRPPRSSPSLSSSSSEVSPAPGKMDRLAQQVMEEIVAGEPTASQDVASSAVVQEILEDVSSKPPQAASAPRGSRIPRILPPPPPSTPKVRSFKKPQFARHSTPAQPQVAKKPTPPRRVPSSGTSVASNPAYSGNPLVPIQIPGPEERRLLKKLHQKERELGIDHPNLSGILLKLAELYERQDRKLDAVQPYLRSLEMWQRALGKGHPELARLLNNVGNLYLDLQRYGEAEAYFWKALGIREKALGRQHPEVARLMTNLAYTDLLRGDAEAGEGMIHRSLKILEQTLGDDHPGLAWTLAVAGMLDVAQGETKKAREVFERSLILGEKRGAPDPELLAAYAQLLRREGQVARAEELEQRRKRLLGGA